MEAPVLVLSQFVSWGCVRKKRSNVLSRRLHSESVARTQLNPAPPPPMLSPLYNLVSPQSASEGSLQAYTGGCQNNHSVCTLAFGGRSVALSLQYLPQELHDLPSLHLINIYKAL